MTKAKGPKKNDVFLKLASLYLDKRHLLKLTGIGASLSLLHYLQNLIWIWYISCKHFSSKNTLFQLL